MNQYLAAIGFVMAIVIIAAIFDALIVKREPLTESNAEAVGDGAWFDPLAKNKSTRSDMSEPMGM